MKKVSFSIEKYELEEISNSQFSKLKLYICHDLDNKNGSYISLDSMKKAENTLWNKPIIMKLNRFGNDFEEHETDVIVVGMIPQNESNIHYEELNGRNYLVADAIIWKYYSSETLEIFKRNETKGISMEIQVIDEHKRLEDGLVQIDDYVYLAVCLLGDRHETGMYDTTAKMMQFSKKNTIDNLRKEWMFFMRNLNKIKVSSSDRLNKRKSPKNKNNKQFIKNIKSISRNILNISEDIVFDIIKQYDELKISKDNFSELGFSESEFLEVQKFIKEVQKMKGDKKKFSNEDIDEKEKMSVEAVKTTDSKEEMTKEECKEDSKEEFNDVMSKEECQEDSKEEAKEEFNDVMSKEECKEDSKEESKEEMAKEIDETEDSEEDSKEDFKAMYSELLSKFECLKEQMAEKDTALLSLNAEFEAEKECKSKFEKEIESLKQYKTNIEKSEKSEKMKDTFSVLSNVLSKEEIDEWKSKSEKYEDISLFEKEIKSFACDKLLKTKSVTGNTQFSKMAVNLDSVDETDVQDENVWTRIGKRVSK